MQKLAKLGVFSYWIVSSVALTFLTDFFIGIVLSVGTTFLVAYMAEQWISQISNTERS